jgi:hypothetical protein
MKFPWSVQAYSNEEIVPAPKASPISVNEQAVCLYCVANCFARVRMASLQPYRSLKEVKPHERRFATLPAK